MTCSTSSSTSLAAAVVLAVVAAGCAGPRASQTREIVRVGVLPLQNLTGTPVPLRDMQAALEREVAAAGAEVVGGDAVGEFLARHRIRHTGAVDRRAARAAAKELGVDALLVTSVNQYRAMGVPAIAFAMRLVSTVDGEVIWADGAASTGTATVGFLGLGGISEMSVLQPRVLRGLRGTLRGFLRDRRRAAPCEADDRFEPVVAFRSPELNGRYGASMAVLPFLNQTRRRAAGELMALAFVREIAAKPTFVPLEPGVVLTEVLRFRMVQEAGVSLEQARLLGDTLGVDLVLAGVVHRYDEGESAQRPPRIDFSVTVIDARTKRIVWESTSHGRGDDGVWFFDAGRLQTATELACRMVRNVLDDIAGKARPLPAVPAPPKGGEASSRAPGRSEGAASLGG